MKEITIILLIAIAIIGAIAIIITKLYYKDKEEKEEFDLNKELSINRGYYPPKQSQRRVRRDPNFQQNAQRQRELAAFSQTIPSNSNKDDMFNDYYGEPIDNKFVNGQNRRPVHQASRSQGNRPNTSRQLQTPKTEEIKKIINEQKPIQPATDAEKVASKISQDPMTAEQKEFIKEHKKGKLVIDNAGGSGIKVIKSDSDDSNTTNTENTETKFGEIKRVNVNETPVVSHTETSSEPINVNNIDPKVLEETLQDLLKDSNIENTPLIQEISDDISSDKTEAPKEESETKTEVKAKEKEEISEDELETEGNKDKSYIGKLPVFKKEKPKNGETTLDDHQPQGYVDDIPNTDSLETKEEEEEEIEGVITPIHSNNVEDAVETVENLRSNLTNEEEYEDDFISITPLSEEEIRAEFQEESATINPINEPIESDALKEFKNNIDETAKEKEEAKEELRKLREENTAKLFNVSKENKESLNSISQNGDSVHKVESINPPEHKEEIVIDGEIYEVSKGMSIMFVHNNETYSSAILALKPGFVGVKYRGRNVWVKHSRIKKVFK